MENISKHCTYREGIKSNTAIKRGIDNTPNQQQIENMKLVAEKCFEPVRTHFGVPIAVTSFFRSVELNSAIGGSRTSEHCAGKAMDIDADVYGGVTNAEIFDYIRNNCEFNQLIWEYGTEFQPDWVHVSYNQGANKNQVLRVQRINGKSVYSQY